MVLFIICFIVASTSLQKKLNSPSPTKWRKNVLSSNLEKRRRICKKDTRSPEIRDPRACIKVSLCDMSDMSVKTNLLFSIHDIYLSKTIDGAWYDLREPFRTMKRRRHMNNGWCFHSVQSRFRLYYAISTLQSRFTRRIVMKLEADSLDNQMV